LAANPGTHVACCCVDYRKPERTRYFFDACALLKSVPFVVAGEFAMWDLDVRPILAFAATYDLIITHNEKGEYGHPAHVKLHHAMKSLGRPMKVFGYGLAAGEPIDYETKMRALECYRDPGILAHIGRLFDLKRETLI
jgi:hypothetical protein